MVLCVTALDLQECTYWTLCRSYNDDDAGERADNGRMSSSSCGRVSVITENYLISLLLAGTICTIGLK